MIKYFEEDGSLAQAGKDLLVRFTGALEMLFDTDELQALTEAELRMMCSNMLDIVANRFSKRLNFKQGNANKYATMTDQQFEDYLKDKYGEGWQFMTLTQEELQRVPPLDLEKLKELLEEDRKKVAPYYHRGGFIPRGFFRV